MAKKPKMGRPTEYDPKYCDQFIEYFSAPPYTSETQEVVTKTGSVARLTVNVPSDFPTVAGFAISIKIHRTTLRDWSKRHPEFGAAYAWAELYQERYLTVNGLKGLISPPAYVWTSKNVLRWRDVQPGEKDHTVTHEGEIKKTIVKMDLDERAKQLKDKA